MKITFFVAITPVPKVAMSKHYNWWRLQNGTLFLEFLTPEDRILRLFQDFFSRRPPHVSHEA